MISRWVPEIGDVPGVAARLRPVATRAALLAGGGVGGPGGGGSMRRLVAMIVMLSAPVGLGGASPARGQAVDTLAASAAVAAFEANCRAVGEALWGRSLCGPLVLVHAPTRAALTSRPDPAGTFSPVAGVYAGRLPDGMPMANTAVEWGGERWAMVLLPLSADLRARYALLAHESFHRAQPELGFELTDPSSAHLDERDGRIWLRLELRALARALETSGEVATRAAVDALVFRGHRHALYPGADTLEAMLELSEGLAEYTGVRYAAMVLGDDVAWTARATREFENRPSFVRSFAYATGPALGLLLDRLEPGWRSRVHRRGPAALLADALLADALVGAAVPTVGEAELHERAFAYGLADVAAEEAERAARLAARLADIRRRLVDGPSLLLRQSNLNAMFNPNELVPVPGEGTYYPTGSFRAVWGRLDVREGGALVSQDWTALRLSAADLRVEGHVVHGPGWTLELADGWSIRRSDAGWEVVR
jgi:hypothetical protein